MIGHQIKESLQTAQAYYASGVQGNISVNEDQSAVGTAVRRLKEKMQMIDSSLSVLVERLHPVLAETTPPTPPSFGEPDAIRAPANCSLESKIDEVTDRLDFILARLDSARSRLCI